MLNDLLVTYHYSIHEKGLVTCLMAIIPELNEKKTRENVRRLLKKYIPMIRQTSYSDNLYDLSKGIEYSDMPKNLSNRNNQEYKTAMMFRYVRKEHLNQTKQIIEIERSLKLLPDIYQKILKYSYCQIDCYTINEIACKIKGYRVNEYGKYEEFNYSVKTIEKFKAEALLQFAESYEGGKLQSFN